MAIGLAYGVLYMLVAVAVTELGFAVTGPLRGPSLLLATLGLFAASNAAGGCTVWAIWRRRRQAKTIERE